MESFEITLDGGGLYNSYFVALVLQLVVNSMASVGGIHAPKILLVAILLSGVSWLISLATGEKIWHLGPKDAGWWAAFAKWVIVNGLATGPLLYVKIANPGPQGLRRTSIFLYTILGCNVIWTIAFPMDTHVETINGATAIVLTIGLAVHFWAMVKAERLIQIAAGDQILAECWFLHLDQDGVVCGRITSLCWLACYTVWNAIFVIGSDVAHLFQDFMFWAMMFHLYYYSKCRRPIEDYFTHARPVQLGAYIGAGVCMGIIPYFKDADYEDDYLHIQTHSSCLFAVWLNLAFSAGVLVWEIECVRDPRKAIEASLRTYVKAMEFELDFDRIGLVEAGRQPSTIGNTVRDKE